MKDEGSDLAREAIFEVIENQIRDGSPPQVAETLRRLEEGGHSREEAMKLIGCAVSDELFEIMKYGKPFDEERYVNNLGSSRNRVGEFWAF